MRKHNTFLFHDENLSDNPERTAARTLLTLTEAFDSLPDNSRATCLGVSNFVVVSRNVEYQSRVDSLYVTSTRVTPKRMGRAKQQPDVKC